MVNATRPEIMAFALRACGTRLRAFDAHGFRVTVEPSAGLARDDADARAARFAELLADAAAGLPAVAPCPAPAPAQEPTPEASAPAAATGPEAVRLPSPVATPAIAPSLAAGDRVQIVKGCTARGLNKGVTCRVQSVTELGADYGHSVRVTLQVLNGFKSGQTVSFCARHVNRLSDALVRMNDGNPSHTIEVRRASAPR